MLTKSIVFFLIFTSVLSASILKPNYTVSSKDFNASAIDQNIKKDFVIYHFEKNKHKKTFNSAYLLKIFNEHSIKLEDESKGLVHVKHETYVDLEPIINAIKKYYQEHYTNIQIDSVDLEPSSFIQDLHEPYEIIFKSKAYMYNSSSLQIQILHSKKRHFINYKINAKLKLFKARSNLNRGKILTRIDMLYKLEDFTKLKGTPIKPSDGTQVRLKKRLQEGKIIYEHNIEALPAVLKGKNVLAHIVDENVHLEFQAKSLQDASIGDIIYIEKDDGLRLRAKVTGNNQVEIR